jgi:hypothetical protein
MSDTDLRKEIEDLRDLVDSLCAYALEPQKIDSEEAVRLQMAKKAQRNGLRYLKEAFIRGQLHDLHLQMSNLHDKRRVLLEDYPHLRSEE